MKEVQIIKYSVLRRIVVEEYLVLLLPRRLGHYSLEAFALLRLIISRNGSLNFDSFKHVCLASSVDGLEDITII